MADEVGALCDQCDPAPVAPSAVPREAWVTWTLIAITAVASAAALIFTHEQFPPGAKFGPRIAAGQWWRLASANFVHYSLGHFIWNMIPLAFLGSRLERILGRWTYLAFYLTCGVTGNVLSLIAAPEQPGAGASGAVFGVCAGLFVHYALRVRTLSRNQRIRLVALGMYIWSAFWPGFANIHVDNFCHVGGLAAGVILGCILSTTFGRPRFARGVVFAAAAIVLAVSSFEFRQHNLYLVHLDAAARALQNGRNDLAAEQLRIAQKMNPDSPIGRFLRQKLNNPGDE